LFAKPAALIVGLVALLALGSCGGAASPFEELEQIAEVQRGTPTLVFVYTDG
jgi:hypothetical protein